MEDQIMNLVKFSNQYPSVFDRFFDNNMLDWTHRNFSDTNTTLPSVNIAENVNEYKVEVAAPGFGKEDFKIEINDTVLSIASEKKIENEEKDGERITKREFSYQSFKREFSLPVLINRDEINAKYENGILSIIIPKMEEAKPRPLTSIEIS